VVQEPAYYKNHWFLGLWIVFILSSIALYVFTGSHQCLLIPLVFMYMALLVVDWKAAYWLMLFTIPFSYEVGLANGTFSISLPDEPMMWLFMLLTIVFVVSNPAYIQRWWLSDSLTIIILLQFVWLLVAIMFSTVPLLSIKFLLAKTWILTCFFVLPLWVFRTKADIKRMFRILLLPVVATVVVIMVGHWQRDFSFVTINDAIGKLYYNHVEYSTVLSMFFPVLFVAYSLVKKEKIWIRRALLLVILLFIPALFFTYARAAVLAVIFAGVVALAIRLRLVNFIMPVFYGTIALLVVYLARDNRYIDFRPNYEQTYMHRGFVDHLVATFQGKDMSSMERVHRWIAAVRMSTDKPVTGYGPHGFYNNYKPYTVLSFRTYVSRNAERSTTHNYYLYMLTEQGWPAMLLYALLIPVVFSRAQKVYHRFNDKFYKHCTIGLAMVIAACFVNNFFSDLLETHKIGAMFYLSVVLLVILNHKSREVQPV
jgi:O-antigen ligase